MNKNTAENSPLSKKEQKQKAKQHFDGSAYPRNASGIFTAGGLKYRIILLIFKCRLSFAAVWVGKLANYLNARAVS